MFDITTFTNTKLEVAHPHHISQHPTPPDPTPPYSTTHPSHSQYSTPHPNRQVKKDQIYIVELRTDDVPVDAARTGDVGFPLIRGQSGNTGHCTIGMSVLSAIISGYVVLELMPPLIPLLNI